MINKLEIKNLKVRTGTKQILNGVDLTIRPGKIMALMGPNGSGKSTLAQVIMGHPDYQVTKGQVKFGGRNVLNLEPWQRSTMGIFLAFQYPYEIPGLNLFEFLMSIAQVSQGKSFKIDEYNKNLKKYCQELKISDKFLSRSLNQGFSGGEKKRIEILQLKILKPKIAILDETDSGLDIDALRLIAKNIKQEVNKYNLGILVITHYQRLLNHLKPDQVGVMNAGKIIKTGKADLVKKLEHKGYDWLIKS